MTFINVYVDREQSTEKTDQKALLHYELRLSVLMLFSSLQNIANVFLHILVIVSRAKLTQHKIMRLTLQ